MASARGMAYRREAAEIRLQAAVSALTQADGRDFISPEPRNRDPIYNDVIRTEHLAAVLSTLAGIDESGLNVETESEPLVNELEDEASEDAIDESTEPEGSDDNEGVEAPSEPESAEKPVDEAPPAEEVPVEGLDLEGLTRAQLNELADEIGINNASKFKEANLKEAIQFKIDNPSEDEDE